MAKSSFEIFEVDPEL